uniref:SFRICE_005410 n=1 Tax=Spodoptera frugiperda TaxID=7108 RepID=A0A2H1W5S9_SPOFR
MQAKGCSATVSAGLRTASKDNSPPDQNQTRAGPSAPLHPVSVSSSAPVNDATEVVLVSFSRHRHKESSRIAQPTIWPPNNATLLARIKMACGTSYERLYFMSAITILLRRMMLLG